MTPADHSHRAATAHRGRTTAHRWDAVVATGAIAVLVGALGACSDEHEESIGTVEFVDEAPASAVVAGDDAEETSVELSSTLFASADVAVVATEDDDVEKLADLSATAHLPLLVGTGHDVSDELDRLDAGSVVTGRGTDLSDLPGDREVTEVDLDADDAAQSLPRLTIDGDGAGASMLVDPDADVPAQAVARADVAAARGDVDELAGGDPRVDSDTVAAAKDVAGDDPSTGVLALGKDFGSSEDLIAHLRTALTVPELPGGGQLAFPGRRMVAAYGTPGIPALGILGEHDRDATLARVKELADDYQQFSDEPVVPALEIITTVASASPGPDGDYSTEQDPTEIADWIDAAADAGIYVVLDLQSGRSDFLSQAEKYEDLLTKPNVGLALDPEWRLKPDQKPLEQIGSVSASEVNETSEWLAELTEHNDLPQKVFILHQFNQSMIIDRTDLDTSHSQLAMLVHADGNGTPEMKMDTWDALQTDLPDGIDMAWKNFYDEDSPTFTPEQTLDIDPQPWFISYQ